MAQAAPHPRGSWLIPSTLAVEDEAVVLARAAERDVVFLGESHDDALVHRWQLRVAAALRRSRPDVALGFEMFPRQVQPVLDRWVAGEFNAEQFLAAVDWPTVWGFDAALYLPLFEFCRDHHLPMVALNCRRELVGAVGRAGWDAVPPEHRDGLTPPAPVSAAYRRYLFAATKGGAMGGRPGAASPIDPAFDRVVRAQACWDRAFACNIAAFQSRFARPPLVVGIVGRGHVEYGFGVPHQLADLGLTRTAVLLPTRDAEHDPSAIAGVADALFRLEEG
ncbi:ChaN family lipoprotein [Blastochloris viridis]|uniref:PDZ domain protein n=1 Tax=Blastochloris viridis TaxID=1079 RepID=A0A0H5BG99_BLAVI|nr:ChaN family lipoprotein [Blastochloris viridis]ALK09936.1 hypothetical protein BVIR_2167 [Blastochloris viridis]BAS00155.1 PDZ domain protein [Blastochloris viridis]CUU42599.1 putative iron-regulated protein [Blastochloris viridis]